MIISQADKDKEVHKDLPIKECNLTLKVNSRSDCCMVTLPKKFCVKHNINCGDDISFVIHAIDKQKKVIHLTHVVGKC